MPRTPSRSKLRAPDAALRPDELQTAASVSPMDDSALSRRAFLRQGALTVLGASTLAGCGSSNSAPASTSRSTAASTTGSTSITTASSARASGPPTAADWAHLERALSGRLVLPKGPSYAAAKLVYDLRFDAAEPAAIAYCATATDVQRTIDFARATAHADPALRRSQLRRLPPAPD